MHRPSTCLGWIGGHSPSCRADHISSIFFCKKLVQVTRGPLSKYCPGPGSSQSQKPASPVWPPCGLDFDEGCIATGSESSPLISPAYPSPEAANTEKVPSVLQNVTLTLVSHSRLISEMSQKYLGFKPSTLPTKSRLNDPNRARTVDAMIHFPERHR